MAVSGVTSAAARCPAAACGQDPARISLAGVYLGQAVAALAGVLALGGEYSTGMIHVTLAAIPRRRRLLAAKALVLGGPVLLASALALGAATLAGVIPAGPRVHRRPRLRPGQLGDGASLVLRDGVPDAGRPARPWRYRDRARLRRAIGVVLGLLYLFPVAALAVGNQAVQRRLEQIGPMSAGLDSQATIDLHSLPLAPWAGLGVVALWAAGALAARWRAAPAARRVTAGSHH